MILSEVWWCNMLLMIEQSLVEDVEVDIIGFTWELVHALKFVGRCLMLDNRGLS